MPAIVEALDNLAVVADADSCQLIELSESGDVVETFTSAGSANTPAGIPNTVMESWLKERLATGRVHRHGFAGWFPHGWMLDADGPGRVGQRRDWRAGGARLQAGSSMVAGPN